MDARSILGNSAIMVTEERSAKTTRNPTDSELEEFVELADRIKSLKNRIDHVRNRLAHGVRVTESERSALLNDRIELERLLVKAEGFMARFG